MKITNMVNLDSEHRRHGEVNAMLPPLGLRGFELAGLAASLGSPSTVPPEMF